MIHLILLSGGSGTRLWPLSNNARSKQFLKVLRDGDGNHISMVQRVFGQISRVPGRTGAQLDVTIATSANQEASIRGQLPGGYELVLEPERRDTAPAIMLACAHLEMVQGADPGDAVVVMPIDTFADQEYYDSIPALAGAVQEGSSELVLMGVCPSFPSEKYGYIIPEGAGAHGPAGAPGAQAPGPLPVREFKEKPDRAAAEEYIAQDGLWNCGVFAFRLSYLRGVTKSYLDAGSFEQVLAGYGELPKTSFDYAVVEGAKSVSVVPYAGTWKDLGTWNTLCEEMDEWAAGRVVASGVDNVHVVNETGLPMVVAGLKDAVVVATHDGILACSKEASASIRRQVEEVGETRPMYERRRWGEYRVLDSRAYGHGRSSLVKELVVAAGCQLSYQRHAHRSEAWTVTAGAGEVVLDGKVTPVVAGTAIQIHPMQMHAVRAVEELHIVEVQLGDPLVEDDIERFGDFWDEEEPQLSEGAAVEEGAI